MLKINEASNMLHTNPNALRFYEKKGIIAPHRDENAYQEYTMDDIARIQIVLLYRRIGFSFEMIIKLLEKEESPVDLFFRQYDILNRHVHSTSLIRDSLACCIDQMLEERNDPEAEHSGSNDCNITIRKPPAGQFSHFAISASSDAVFSNTAIALAEIQGSTSR